MENNPSKPLPTSQRDSLPPIELPENWNELEHRPALKQDPAWVATIVPLGADTLYSENELPLPRLTADTPDFLYTRLAQDKGLIRLLHLFPAANDDDAIPRLSIKTVRLDQRPKYFALSYCWGSTAHTFAVLIDGCKLLVTENLYYALRQLQTANSVLPIWIDALCINQEDDREKSHQVQQMGDIYSNAQLVLGWLGPSAESSDVAIKALALLSRLGKTIYDLSEQEACDSVSYAINSSELEHMKDERLKEVVASFGSEEDAKTGRGFPYHAVSAVMSRSWWRRIWILQEVVLAKKAYILCGDTDILYRNLVLGVGLLHLGTAAIMFSHPSATRALKSGPLPPLLKIATVDDGRRSSFGSLLDQTAGMEATDKRDHVLALLAITSDDTALGIIADYTISYTELYTRVAELQVGKYESLRFLSRSQPSNNSLPSWVPDWSSPYKGAIWTRTGLYNACGSRDTASSQSASNKLILTGAVFSIVKAVSKKRSSSEEKRSIDLVAWLKYVEQFTTANCTSYQSPDEVEDAVWRTVVADSIHDLQAGLSFATEAKGCVRATEDWRGAYRSLEDDLAALQLKDTDHTKILWNSVPLFGRATALLDCNLRLLATECGYLGLGPAEMEPGDLVCLFDGAEVPFVLREVEPHSSTGDHVSNGKGEPVYRLVGESYVHGIMDGEFIDQSTPPPSQQFTVC